MLCAPSHYAQSAFVEVVVQGQRNTFSNSSLFGYRPPVVTAVSPQSCSSAGNVELSFWGFNFGPPSSPLTVTLQKRSAPSIPCIVSVSALH